MASPTTFQAASHQVDVLRKGGRYIVSVDGREQGSYQLTGKSKWITNSQDFEFPIDGVPYILAVRKGKARLATNNYFLDDNEPFTPAVAPPGWIWFFFILNMLMVIGGGAVPFLLALLGVALCTSVAASKLQNIAVKFLLCTIITIGMWCALLAVSYLLTAVWY